MEAVARIEDFRHGRVPRVVRERQLVELGEELFAERGYAKASMDELARRAGVTKPVIYELFGSKEGLFRACLEGLALRLADAIAEAARGADAASGPDPESRPSAGGPASASPPAGEPDPEARLRAGGLAFLRFAQENRLTLHLVEGDHRLHSALPFLRYLFQYFLVESRRARFVP